MDAVKGFDFSADNKMSASGLNSLASAATFSNMALGDFKSTERPIHKSGSSPSSPALGQLWYKIAANGNSTNPAAILLAWNGVSWYPIANGAILTSNTSVPVSYGMAVKVSGSASRFSVATGADGDNTVIGLAGESIVLNQSGIILTHGFAVPSVVSGSSVRMGFLQSSSAGGNGAVKATSSTISTGCFGRILDITNNLCILQGMMKVT